MRSALVLRRLPALVLVLLIVPAGPARSQGVRKRRPLPAEYGRVVMDNASTRNNVAPVVFDHWTHRMKYTCRVCHVDVGFAMQANETRVHEEDNRKGFFCGACHNGKIAFGPRHDATGGDDPSCERCHSLGKRPAAPELARLTEGFPRGRFGNGIDWEAAELQKKIRPANSLPGVSIQRKPLEIPKDYDIEAKVATLPEIIFSHQKHAVWGGCELCHPDIFTVKRGATKFTMEEIFKGRYCGACHGTVAFPTTDCQRCHTKPVVAAG
ncbi:MAG TPA: c(7)-type cytochrome triheme domain-containing protein [bacterium]